MKLFLVLFLLPLPFAAYGKEENINLCLHVYSWSGMDTVTDMMSGHVGLSIEQNGITTKTVSYWPGKNVWVNGKYDGYLTKKEVLQEYIDNFHKNYPLANPQIQQQKYCRRVHWADLVRMNKLIAGYQKKFGAWNDYPNNCVAFGTYIFKQVTGEIFDVPMGQPTALASMIHAANVQNRTLTYVSYGMSMDKTLSELTEITRDQYIRPFAPAVGLDGEPLNCQP